MIDPAPFRNRLAIIIMTRNEAANIRACLASIAGFPHIYVVDSQSTDNTVAQAQAMGAEIIPFVWNGAYPRKKEWCRRHVAPGCPWLLYLDADERMNPALAKALVMALNGPATAFWIRSHMVWMGRRLRFGTRYRKIALIRRDAAHFPDLNDHHMMGDWAVEGHVQPVIKGRVGRLCGALTHEDAKGLSAWFARHNRYSDWEAARATNPMTHSAAPSLRECIKRLRTGLPGWPLWRFLGDYVLLLGFLDGRAGFDHALARAFYAWQIRLKISAARAAAPTATAGADDGAQGH